MGNRIQRNYDPLEQIPAAISFAGTFCVIIIYLTFQKLRRFRHIELVFYISCSDFVVSIGLLLGNAPTGTFGCWFQGLVETSFCLISVFWNAVVAYQIYLVVVKKETIQNMLYFHLVCWGLPVVLTLLPLSTVTYGNSDSYSAGCYLSNRPNSLPWYILFWEVAAFFVWLWLAIGIIIYYYALVLIRLKEMQFIPPAISLSVKQLVFYPLIVMFCWMLNTVFCILFGLNINVDAGPNSAAYVVLGSLSVILPACQGALSAVVFFLQNQNARNYFLLLCQCRVSEDQSADAANDRPVIVDANENVANALTTPLHIDDKSSYWRSEMPTSWVGDPDERISDLELGYARESNLIAQDPMRGFIFVRRASSRLPPYYAATPLMLFSGTGRRSEET